MNVETALLNAIEEKSEGRLIEILQTTDVDLFNSKALGFKLLLSAVSTEGNERIIEILLTCGALPYYKVLETAIQFYDKHIIDKLFEHVEDVNVTSYFKYNLLHEVAWARGDKAEVCEVLIKYGVEVNQESLHCRRTPLYHAIERKNLNVLNTLLKYGAEPCRKFDGALGVCTPLQFVFTLPAASVENVVKYAALQIDHSDDKKMYDFFSYFRREKSKNDQSKQYFSYAMKCVAEARALKTFVIDDLGSTLHDLALALGDEQKALVENNDVIDRAFNHLVTQPFVIYSEIIVHKFHPIVVLRKILENSGRKWSVTVQNKKIYFDAFCIEKICEFLPKNDMVNMFLAFTAFPEKYKGKGKSKRKWMY